jgi:pilus assembly protein CpaC
MLLVTLAYARGAPAGAGAQLVGVEETITIPRGRSELVIPPAPVQRISIGDPEIADAVVITPREVLLNARSLGTTTLIVWDVAGNRWTYTVEVVVDVAALERTFATFFPGEQVRVGAIGNVVVLAGTVTSGAVARRALELAAATGAVVIDNLIVQAQQQILLQVRVAEVSEAAIQEFSSQIAAMNPRQLEGTGDWFLETISEGLIRLFLLDPTAELDVVLRALRTTTNFRTLAEPNLLALDGAEASFLAGGEFPFPIAQPGAAAGAVTIQWREFGVRLSFIPTVTPGGSIRLRVAPEVSQLDFASGLVLSGFAIPSILTRRAETEIELRDGQTFAIAGLLDNNTLDSVTRIPVLGDLPIIGALFRSRQRRENRTELLVLVTPRLIAPMDQAPPVPTGEPETWPGFDRWLQPPAPHPMPVPQPGS